MGGHSNHAEAMEWPEEVEKYFLEILVERVKRDPNHALSFKGNDWIEMDELIFLKFALRYGGHKLRAKYFRLRTMHIKFTELINTIGVTWDSNSGQVFASDTIWNDYLKRDKIFKSFKKKGCKLYPLLGVLFNNSTTTGVFHNASTSAPQTSEEEQRMDQEYIGVDSEYKLGPAGSNEGEQWDLKGKTGIAQIFISYGEYVHSIQFQYVENGRLVMSPIFGRSDFTAPGFEAIKLEYPTEKITGISGQYDSCVEELMFSTNRRTYGQFGDPDYQKKRKKFNYNFGSHNQFAGFHGTHDGHSLKSIGVYFNPNSTITATPTAAIPITTFSGDGGGNGNGRNSQDDYVGDCY